MQRKKRMTPIPILNNDWDTILKEEFEKQYFQQLLDQVNTEYQTKTIFPPQCDVFNAFRYSSYENTKVVILGQDPYHEKGQAHGLAFSVKKGIPQPPSLVNIFKELKSDLNIDPPNKNMGELTSWAKQGVLLLNATLTVEEHKANSHQNYGWQTFTDHVIEKLNEKTEPIVFILWGRNAKAKKSLITNKNHLIIESAHPSPFSANYGFFGSKPFSKTNDFLAKSQQNGQTQKTINWAVQ